MKQFMIAFMMMFAVSISMMGQASPKKATVTKDTSNVTMSVQTASADSATADSATEDYNGELKSLKEEFHGIPFENSEAMLIPIVDHFLYFLV
ncbi:MAG: hypothetical protein H6Q12_674 [Bacteroidetes bacterium]|nr:hypothetical protein [Bacteroidota bacterium]